MAIDAPDAVARRLFDALGERAWMNAAALMDEAVLADMRDGATGRIALQLEHEADPPAGTGGMSVDSDSVAELVGRYAHAPMPVLDVSGVATVRTLGDLAALPPRQFFAWWLAAADDVRRRVAERRIVGVVVEEVAKLAEASGETNDAYAHVLYRSRGGVERHPWHPWDVHRLALRRAEGGWLALVNGEIAEDSTIWYWVYRSRQEQSGADE